MSQPRGTTATAAVAQRWMEMVLGEKFPRDFAAELRAGHALCALAGKVFKALGMKEQVLALAPPAEAKHPRYSGERLPSGATQRIRAYLRYVEREGRQRRRRTVGGRDRGDDADGCLRRTARATCSEWMWTTCLSRTTCCDIRTWTKVREGGRRKRRRRSDMAHVGLLLVYRNILALQAVAVSLSTRRSIDERSSLGAKPVRTSER